jgi:hypothetical protein
MQGRTGRFVLLDDLDAEQSAGRFAMDRIGWIRVLACTLLCIDPEEEVNTPCGLPNLFLPVGFQSQKARPVRHLNARHRYV